MVFSSITFLFYFLPLFFLLYYLSAGHNLILLTASVLFYAWGEPRYLPLLFFYIVINWALGLWLEHTTKDRRWILTIGIASNLALLFYFKYFNFFIDQLNAIRRTLDLEVWSTGVIPLALGISFFTFQAISYLVDVFRGDVAAERSLLTFATYMAMFPKLVAGPIVRYKEVAGRLSRRVILPSRMRYGIQRLMLGLAQKVLIANTVALPADEIFALSPHDLTAATAWLGIACYTLQIYFDFAGYSNMAIGLAHMMGFTFPENFNRPYASQSITEFWRRWHMTLSGWLRDYLYIPLGGNRLSHARTYANLVIVFVLCGFWHGASWTFLAWGLYQGIFLVLERAGLAAALSALWCPLRHLYLVIAVMIGWVLFRSETIVQAGQYLMAMFGSGQGEPLMTPVARYLTPSVLMAITVGVLFSVAAVPGEKRIIARLRKHLGTGPGSRVLPEVGVRVALDLGSLALLGFAALIMATGTYNPFLYFRF